MTSLSQVFAICLSCPTVALCFTALKPQYVKVFVLKSNLLFCAVTSLLHVDTDVNFKLSSKKKANETLLFSLLSTCSLNFQLLFVA